MATVDRKDEYGTAKYDVNGQDQMDLHPNDSQDNALRKIRTAGSVAIPPELFEKLYLNPESKVKDLCGLGGFLLSLTPLSCYLMDWRNT
ncbi:hypothetical protein CLAFUW4_13252 [Fulvia fulva]|uniref:Uncharacterized protein n=1 Tax=Passalora fulva TaxID=5499 RepID=A0A9Q8UV09_PASFU|nr:uncharacterized protein CLAFUR5_13108 [Fulvia fulva]KAK4611948.1 hypothetical protein CLAFUR4_13257 [Fulvia fulva]KAK4612420.1 hypothetical protein CLAFUR0_13262 [Fulvia fulva]UJO23516.1 hypothetical protein CLAFUR5_13108 [Fulvia fulva]WPV20995.1 hypothetical protein CLAFUW4_13252 [Fulvia fulva]WPV36631.1 hypothetical protein CLAFUW7_13259 [Fulvia fulva]